MKLFFNLLMTVSLMVGQFAAPINNTSSPYLQEPPTPTATGIVTETPTITQITTETPTGTTTNTTTATDTGTPGVDVPPSATPTTGVSEVIPSETPAPPTIIATQTPLATSIVTSSPTSTAVDTQTQTPLFSLSLSSTPAFLTSGGNIKLDWVIDGPLPKNNKFILQIVIAEGFEPNLKANDSGSFDSATRILSIAAPDPQGSVQVQADYVTADSLFSANLLNGQELAAIASFVLPLKEKFEVSAAGGNIAPMNGKVKVTFPQGALSEAVTVDFGSPSQDAAPSHSLSGQPFEIKAHGKQSKTEFSQFNEEIVIEVQYEDYVTASEGAENDLYLWWYNPQTEEWVALASEVDVKTKTLRATTSHFSVFDIGFNTWNASHVPTTDGFQTAEFTGAGTYSLPIEVPPGPGGFQPNLSLSYNSQVIDQSNINPENPTQASWTGMGWSLDTGSIELDYRDLTNNNTALLSVNGVSSRIVKDPNTSGVYHLAEENGWKIDFSGELAAGSKWIVKDTVGNTYEFAYIGNYPAACVAVVPHKWMLTKQTNSFGQSILYSYVTETKGITPSCGASTVTTAAYISTITYPNSRYRVRFELAPRTDYLATWETGANFYAFQKSYLKNIFVEQDLSGNGSFSSSKTIRKYELDYNTTYTIWPAYDYNNAAPGGQILTLNAVKQYGEGGAALFQTHTFSYADSMHLTQVNNGFGGIVTFDYPANLAYASPNPRDLQRQPPITNPPTPASAICVGNTTVPWVLESGTIRCTTAVYPSIEISPNSVARLKGNLVRPGGIYKVTALIAYSTTATARARLGIEYANGSYAYSDYQPTASIGSINVNTPPNISYTTPPLPTTLTTIADMVIQAENVANGTVHVYRYTYEPLPTFYRVGTKTAQDGNGHTLTYTYAYENPAMNGVDSYEAKRYSEFRGHGKVTVTHPDGTRIETSYFQTDTLKGKAFQTSVYSGNLASTTTYSYSVTALPVAFTQTTSVPVPPLRYWAYTSQVDTMLYGINGAAIPGGAATTTYLYNANYNLSLKQEYDGNGLYRKTIYEYIPNNTNNITGLVARQQVLDAGGTVLVYKLNLYDGNNIYNAPPVRGNLTGTRIWVGGSDFTQVSYGYDNTWGNQTSVTTYQGFGTETSTPTTGVATTTTTYDLTYHTYPLTIKNAKNQTTTLTYDYTKSVPLSETDPNGAVTSATYDAFGRMTSLTRPLDAGPSLTMSYTSSFPFTTSITQKIDAAQSIMLTRVYDGMGRVTQTNTGGVITDTFYDSPTVTKQSVPYEGTSPNLFTVTTNNPTARTTTVLAPDGTSTSATINGLVTTQTDAKGNATTTTNDVWGRTQSVAPPTGTGPSVSYTYDIFNNLKTANRGGLTTTLYYNNVGQKTSMSDPDMGTWSYTYDGLGNLKTQTDARNCVLTMTYDPLNRLTNKISGGSCGAQVNTTYVYDELGVNGIGRRTSMTNAGSSTSWIYDLRGRTTRETKYITGAPTSAVTSWTYNFADLPITMTYPGDNEVVTTTYNARMQVKSVTGAAPYVDSSTYDSAGRITNRGLGNVLDQVFDYYAWNEKAGTVGQGGRLQNLSTGALQNLSYVYEASGNVKTITNSIASETSAYGYDPLDRLTSWNLNGATETYAYNSTTGNLQSKAGNSYTYETAHPHAVDTYNVSNSYNYDANGNMTSRTVGGYTSTLNYDAEGHLVSVTGNVPPPTASQATHFASASAQDILTSTLALPPLPAYLSLKVFAAPVKQAGNTATPTAPSTVQLDIPIISGSDDAEEFATGTMYLGSSDLELIHDDDNQQVGMRFRDINIPQGATIVNAYVQFSVDETSSEATSLTIKGEANNNPVTFGSSANNISNRPRTSASAAWSPVPWLTLDESGVNQRTPELASIIQETVNRAGWSSGNAMVIIVTGTGKRVAVSYDGYANEAPRLHIEYTTGSSTFTPTATSTSVITSTPTATKTFTPSPTATRTSTSTSTATAAAPTANTFTPMDDAYIESGFPTTNYGSATSLQVDNSPIKHFLIKFNVTGINGQQVTNAKIRLYSVGTSNKGGDFYRVSDNSWQEETVTWNTKPAADATLLASLGAVSPNTWYEVDITSLITGDGTYSLLISSTSTDGADYSSKEGNNPPQLVVTLGGTPVPPPTDTPTATPAPTGTSTSTPTSTFTATPTVTATSTVTSTSTATATSTGTSTSTVTATSTVTSTPTVTATSTGTSTPTATATPTATVPPPPSSINATFTYDGDGNRVKSVVNGVTTYFIGNYFEMVGETLTFTKYYYAGGQRIAVRTYPYGSSASPSYILSDHLGSTSITTNSTGVKLSETRYKAWGEVRYQSGVTPTDYTFTGQYSNVPDFGLLFYNARFYDPSLGRFSSPDSIVPLASQGTQAWDRYAYTNNNPVRYTDPSGHLQADETDGGLGTAGYIYVIKQKFDWKLDDDKEFSHKEVKTIYQTGNDILAYADSVTGGSGLDWTQYAFGNTTITHMETAGEHSETWPTLFGPKIWLGKGWLNDGGWDSKELFAHELGHVWDINSGFANSGELNKDLGGSSWCFFCSPGDGVPQWDPRYHPYNGDAYGNSGRNEYFAEAFSATVYNPTKPPSGVSEWIGTQISINLIEYLVPGGVR